MLVCVLPPSPPQLLLQTLATLAAGAAIWFILTQLLILRRFCGYCMTAHAAAILAAIETTILFHGPHQPSLIGLAALAVLIILQIAIEPKQFQVIRPPTTLAPTVIASAPPAQLPSAATAPVARRVVLLGGRLSFDVAIFPVIGSPQAPHLIANVIDYTCEFCRDLHPKLRSAQEAFAGDLAVLVVCAPLQRECNPLITEIDPHHANACEYARLALAVGIANAARFSEFHDWLMKGPNAPALADARAHAVNLIGAAQLQQSLANPRIQTQFADGVNIYRLTGAGPLPKVLLPTGILAGKISTSEKLIALLREQLAPRS